MFQHLALIIKWIVATYVYIHFNILQIWEDKIYVYNVLKTMKTFIASIAFKGTANFNNTIGAINVIRIFII